MTVSRSEPHPIFAKFPARQWAGSLADLRASLRREAFALASEKTDADRAADKDWTWRVLPNGLFVFMRVRGDMDMRLELRCARSEPIANAKDQAAFDKQVADVLQAFGINAVDGAIPCTKHGREWWIEPAHPNDEGKTAQRFLELREGEIQPGKAMCHDCTIEGRTTVVPWWPMGGVHNQTCDHHRMSVTAGARR